MSPAEKGPELKFFANLMACFSVPFYRRTSGFSVTHAFMHVAGVTAITAVAFVFLIALPEHREFERDILPVIVDFYKNGLHEGIYFEDGKVVYEDVEGYTFSRVVLGRKLAIIVDPDGLDRSIAGEYADVMIMSGDQLLAGAPQDVEEQKLPDERTNAREFFVARVGELANPRVLVIRGINYFAFIFFALVMLITFVSLVLYLGFGQSRAGLTFRQQVIITSFASTPFIVGVMTAPGGQSPRLLWAIPALALLIFLMLAVLGTREYVRYLEESEGAEKAKAVENT